LWLLEHAATKLIAATAGTRTAKRLRRLPVGKLKVMVSPSATGGSRAPTHPAANADMVSRSENEIKVFAATKGMYAVTVWHHRPK
jgi:hypothetical protein